ncbi:MAG: polysaccharide deacetylase family protein [Candidatus Erginobacter occultus]|nr:polysaccharide deacetylase family protein [Candidatus Erginobacter occultus]
MGFLQETIAKNWPELRALLTGGIPAFVTAPRPPPFRGGVVVFCYHLADPVSFEADLRFLAANGYRTTGADELLEYVGNRKTLPEPTVVLTFDDGAVNFYETAFPLLRQYNRRCVLFIAPGLHRRSAEETARERRPCTWEELREMAGSGLVDIQSHTWVHRSLDYWPRPLPLAGIDETLAAARRGRPLSMEEDLRRARAVLEERLDKTVRHLAWPRYYTAPAALALARQVGYQGFWTGTRPRHPLVVPGQDPAAIVRISGEFTRRLPGAGRRKLRTILRIRYGQALAGKWPKR